MEEYDAPDWYEFKHPCGNVVRCEELFFYNPKDPRPLSVIVREADTCLGCACYFYNQEKMKAMCQGLEIKLELDVKISYNKETGERTAIRIK